MLSAYNSTIIMSECCNVLMVRTSILLKIYATGGDSDALSKIRYGV